MLIYSLVIGNITNTMEGFYLFQKFLILNLLIYLRKANFHFSKYDFWI